MFTCTVWSTDVFAVIQSRPPTSTLFPYTTLFRSSFSGLPGVTSHHMRSSFSRFMASRLAAKCAACGGSKVPPNRPIRIRSEEHTSELQSHVNLVCRLLLEKKNKNTDAC